MSNRALILGWRKRWHRSLIQFLRRRVRISVDIEDLAQETYMRLLRSRDLTQVRNPQAYLLKVAGYVVCQWREEHPQQENLAACDENGLIDALDLDVELDAQITRERFQQILAGIPPATRSVLLLRFRDECSRGEIAEKLGMTERQVRRHLVRGYEHLREYVKELNGVSLHG
jgi:RNA polymerase sigma factor (sigma-70 family)